MKIHSQSTSEFLSELRPAHVIYDVVQSVKKALKKYLYYVSGEKVITCTRTVSYAISIPSTLEIMLAKLLEYLSKNIGPDFEHRITSEF